MEATRRIGRAGACIVAAALLGTPPAVAWVQTPADSTVQGGRDSPPVRVRPDYDNRFYKQVQVKLPDVVIERVDDRRGGAPEALGSTGTGMSKKPAQLVLDQPVAEFVQRSFAAMLVTGSSEKPRRIVLRIDQFELTHERHAVTSSKGTFAASLSVALRTDSGEVVLGRVQAREIEKEGFTLTGAQKTALYRGMAAMAQALADPRLGLAAPSELPAARAPAIAPPPQVTAEYRPPPSGATEYGATCLAYQNLSNAQMRDVYGSLAITGLGGVVWLRARPGISFEFRYISAHGSPIVLDPTWSFTHTGMEMWVFGLDLTYLHRLVRDVRQSRLVPYLGLGIDAFIGLDQLEAQASRPQSGEKLNGRVVAGRTNFGGHALAGLQVRLSDSTSLALESRWTQTGPGSTDEGHGKDESASDKVFFDVFHSMVNRPEFDLTGWGLRLGILVRP